MMSDPNSEVHIADKFITTGDAANQVVLTATWENDDGTRPEIHFAFNKHTKTFGIYVQRDGTAATQELLQVWDLS
jgi:hypothetical protein